MSTAEVITQTQAPISHAVQMDQAISSDEIHDALEQILDSSEFKRARRMCRLLRYLIEQTLHGTRRDVSEYAIGLEVFDRDPKTYYPGEDPVVRVQVGRLRERLKEYYANHLFQTNLQFSIPLGNYRPLIERIAKKSASSEKSRRSHLLLSVIPLQYGSEDYSGRLFTQGVNEELCYHLYTVFGAQMISYAALNDLVQGNLPDSEGITGENATYFLEGSIRIDNENVKASIRLIEARSHAIMWSQQFIQQEKLSLLLQEQLARKICEAVRQYMQLGWAQAV